MSWSIDITGTFAGVKANVASKVPRTYPPCIHALINESVDAIQTEYGTHYNGVSIKGCGHGGTISGLTIQNTVLALDPIQGTTPTTS